MRWQRLSFFKLLALAALAALCLLALRADLSKAAGETAVAVAAGGSHTCALTVNTGVKCWGNGSYGQIGDGTFDERRLQPTDVVAGPGVGRLRGIAAIAAGIAHTCALSIGGGVKCWGGNALSQLGDGTAIDSAVPVDVVGLGHDVVAIAAGALHTCALLSTSGVKCWGRNEYGQVGDGTQGDFDDSTTDNIRQVPTDVCATYESAAEKCSEFLSSVVRLGLGGNHSCAVMSSTGVKCWGLNLTGQLGEGTGGFTSILDSPAIRATPADVCQHYDEAAEACVEVLAGAMQVDGGAGHTCAVMHSGSITCWGQDFDGELGNDYACVVPPRVFWCTTPVEVRGLGADALEIVGGNNHTCGLLAGGRVQCWGNNLYHGQLGDGRRCGLQCATPTDVCSGGRPSVCGPPLSGALAISSSVSHSCAVIEDGGAKCWGANLFGQLGSGRCCNDIGAPVDVLGLGGKKGPPPTASPTNTTFPRGTPLAAGPGPTPSVLPTTGAGAPQGQGHQLWLLGGLGIASVAIVAGLALLSRRRPGVGRRAVRAKRR